MRLPIGITQQQAGSPVYEPGMMTFDGSTGYYSKASVTTSGNKVTMTCRFNRASFTGGGTERLFYVQDTVGGYRGNCIIFSNDFADYRAGKIQFYLANASFTIVCLLITTVTVVDGNDHVMFAAYDGDTGSAQLYIDGVDSDDSGAVDRVLTTGTLPSGSNTDLWVGSNDTLASFFGGEIGYFGCRDAYLTNPTDFYHPTNGLQALDTTTWTEWGSQPEVFSPDGKLDTNNLGSYGALTKNGTITGPA